jgi:hypothetical protein
MYTLGMVVLFTEGTKKDNKNLQHLLFYGAGH